MKKFALFLVVVWVFSGVHAEAALPEKMNSTKALDKFGRGVTNIATGPGELVMQVPPAMEKSPDYLTGFIVSIGRGIGYALLRVGAGIYDVATFPFPGPTDYKPIMKPETITNPFGDTTISQTLPTRKT
ncbi:MAG: exosortase system-associated protein, TIGR04073 family [Candidatus Omnitrophota bacterium]